MNFPRALFFSIVILVSALVAAPYSARANSDAPVWMHAAAARPLPTYDDKTDAVMIYAEDLFTVQPNGKIRKTERRAIKILRPSGREHAKRQFYYDPETKITALHGWTIPVQGKDFEVKDKDLTDEGAGGDAGDMITDARAKNMLLPAPDPGNVIGWEVEQDSRPYVLEDRWNFQSIMPVREAHYTLQLPPSWEYVSVFVNHPEIVPSTANALYAWSISDVPPIREEPQMPPWHGVAGRMVLSLLPPGASNKGFQSWAKMGAWYTQLTQGRRDVSPEIHHQVTQLTSSLTAPLPKMEALAKFLQSDVRYVAIELGIGGWQPHAARDIYNHHFGDCKDKATLLSAMLADVGIDSYYVIINADRGAVDATTPPSIHLFDHAILAIKVPEGIADAVLPATIVHPKLGRLLFFDPTDIMTPFGFIRGELQANYAMLVTPDGGELVRLPQLATTRSGIHRIAKLTLDTHGNLIGEVNEVRTGDSAMDQRYRLQYVTKTEERIKPIESMLSSSFGSYDITKATVVNLTQTSLPFGYNYSVAVRDYAKTAGDLVLVRPRVLGSYASGILERKDPRKYPVELDSPAQFTDTFDIALPPGFAVDDLPPPVDVEKSFASYHSKTELKGNTLHYTRILEVKQLTIPLDQIDDLRTFYRIVATDERNNAVLKPGATQAAATPASPKT
jgi:Domain of Unknown Function with PDB structure (DUF3857)/Transglutaminase-like superfamily